jgi:hypothetical protein
MALTHITRVAFGRAIPGGGEVDETQWEVFEREHIARSFPNGFTVIPAHGGWRDATTGTTIEEPTVIVEVAHDGSEEALRAIRIVATIYRALFRQDAVMVVTVPARVEFI